MDFVEMVWNSMVWQEQKNSSGALIYIFAAQLNREMHIFAILGIERCYIFCKKETQIKKDSSPDDHP